MAPSDVLIVRGAELSEDGLYRWTLSRRWSTKPRDVWIMLNPSTADALVDDPTVRRVIGFSRRFGAGGITVVNLFALRATEPAELSRHPDPIGPGNDDAIVRAVETARPLGGRVIAAWGSQVLAAERGRTVRALLPGVPLHCLGLTRGGHPRHPLYVRGDTELIPYTG